MRILLTGANYSILTVDNQARKIAPLQGIKMTEKSDTVPVEQELYNAKPECQHDMVEVWSGVKCTKCNGWYCH